MKICAVCEKHRTLVTLPGGFIFRDAHVFIAHFPLLAAEEAYRGHIIIEMTRHLTSPSQMSLTEAENLGKWVQKVTRALEETLKAEHVYVVRIGDLTPHLHFHLIPRYAGTPRETWGPLINKAPGMPKATATDMIEITEILKRALL